MSTALEIAIEYLISKAFHAGFEQARRYHGAEVAWPGSGPAYVDWRAYGPGCDLDGGRTYRENHARGESLIRQIPPQYMEYGDDVMVCTTHNRFVPCRHGSDTVPCHLSNRPDDIERVRAYQLGWEQPLITRAEFDAKVED